MGEFIDSFEELDIAMAEAFSGIAIDGKKVRMTYYTPDVDLVKVEAPSMVLYRTTPFLDLSRVGQDKEYIDNPILDANGNIIRVDKREAPEPWSVLYTVKTLYEYQIDGVRMNDQMIRVFRKGGFITVKGQHYSVEMVSAGLWGSQYKDFGKIEDGERRFQESYGFRVDFYLEVDTARTVPTATQVNVTNITN